MRSDAIIVEERNGWATWWTLLVGNGTAMSASYLSEASALADAPLWCGVHGRKIEVAVVALPRLEEAAGP